MILQCKFVGTENSIIFSSLSIATKAFGMGIDCNGVVQVISRSMSRKQDCLPVEAILLKEKLGKFTSHGIKIKHLWKLMLYVDELKSMECSAEDNTK